jgi:hypothetical protein
MNSLWTTVNQKAISIQPDRHHRHSIITPPDQGSTKFTRQSTSEIESPPQTRNPAQSVPSAESWRNGYPTSGLKSISSQADTVSTASDINTERIARIIQYVTDNYESSSSDPHEPFKKVSTGLPTSR